MKLNYLRAWTTKNVHVFAFSDAEKRKDVVFAYMKSQGADIKLIEEEADKVRGNDIDIFCK